MNRDLRRRFYIKRYNYQGLGYAIKDLFRSSRARRTWLAANSLHMRGIFVALPLAYLERRRFGFLLESYILTAAVDGEPLRDILRRYRDFGYPLSEKRTLLGALARVVKRLHESGVACRDLKASNLVVDKSESGSFRFHIVDFDGVYFGRVGWRRRMKNLARLAEEAARYRCFTRADRLRFLVNYLGSPARDWKRAWKQVASRL
ncbi:MAG TPA: lipopolysaccharide kinase InaA family protein [Candidatus Acidoferrales bacterium]|nr:lipopolysaccharide kinase InaA family protein [Candidatus Acidoferrales bacterium]